jgi:biotin operon repressor
LFQIIQILRRSSLPVTAAAFAEELEVSKRTVYRDVADLMGQRVPIEGEAGLGYLLASDYDMPPLMLTPDEIEAVVLGAQWQADPTRFSQMRLARRPHSFQLHSRHVGNEIGRQVGVERLYCRLVGRYGAEADEAIRPYEDGTPFGHACLGCIKMHA